jgi:hypothetical protein
MDGHTDRRLLTKEVGLEVNEEKPKCMLSYYQNIGKIMTSRYLTDPVVMWHSNKSEFDSGGN